jgi:hypothetical protein
MNKFCYNLCNSAIFTFVIEIILDDTLLTTTTPVSTLVRNVTESSQLSIEMNKLRDENQQLRLTVSSLTSLVASLESKLDKLSQVVTNNTEDVDFLKTSFESNLVSIDARLVSAQSEIRQVNDTMRSQQELINTQMSSLSSDCFNMKLQARDLVDTAALASVRASLEAQVGSLHDSFTVLNASSVRRDQFAVALGRVQPLTIRKGTWTLRLLYGDVITQPLYAVFETPFANVPRVVYTVRSQRMLYDKPLMYKFVNEYITKENLSAVIEFYGPAAMAELVLEYTAFGV